METRKREADEFYRGVIPGRLTEDEGRVMRQALAGMLWTKQYFGFDVDMWLEEHGVDPIAPGGKQIRNREWFHMVNEHVISMPDKWEYPWYAAWDLAFHTMALSAVDVDFAKEQLDLMLQEFFPPSHRADSGLRMELRRRESASTRLGHHLPVSHRAGSSRHKATSSSSSDRLPS